MHIYYHTSFGRASACHSTCLTVTKENEDLRQQALFTTTYPSGIASNSRHTGIFFDFSFILLADVQGTNNLSETSPALSWGSSASSFPLHLCIL